MPRVDSLRHRWLAVFFLTALLVVVADQLSKAWIRSYPEGQTIFAAGFFRIVQIHNTGAAFGLFPGHSLTLTIIDFVFIAVTLVYVIFFSRRLPFVQNRLSFVALSLILRSP